MIDHRGQLYDFREQLDDVGCGFCLAKWTQVTIHLQTGETHSCHHPIPHKIPLRELKRNPKALHNTRHKKKQRKMMLNGERPDECDYCWKVEDSGPEFSDRHYKSFEPWSKPHFDKIKEMGWREDYNPKYVEVAFSNACNFKCSYCGPQYSSKWVEEVKQHGAYPTSDNFGNLEWLQENGKMPYKHSESNPYVDAFWEWWPELYKDMDTFRITGGEPTMSPDFWRVVEHILTTDNPNTNLKLSINTNLGIPDKIYDKFLAKMIELEESGRVKELTVFTSVDTFGKQAEYARNGLDFPIWQERVDDLLSKTKKLSIAIMSTFNALSVLSYGELLEWVFEMKTEHNSPDRYWVTALTLDSAYLRYPHHQTVKILPKEFRERIEEFVTQAETMHTVIPLWEIEDWKDHYLGFTQIEIGKIKRIIDWFDEEVDEETLNRTRRDFYNFITAHDKRRGTDFIGTFPELSDFYNDCKKLNEEFLQ
jgi:organic radical activating enzyme